MNDATHAPKHDLLFSVRRSVRYHMCRVRFFERLNLAIRFTALLSSVGVVSNALRASGEPWVTVYALAVAAASALDIVLQSGACARRHGMLAARFTDLEKQLVLAGEDCTAPALAQLAAARLEIEANEPPVLRVLDIMCHNELARAMGYEAAHQVPLAWYQRVCAQLFDIRAHVPRAA